MKFLFLAFTLVFSSLAQAQSVDVKDVNAGSDDTTTIEIRKGEKAKKNEALWEVNDGSADVEGDSAATNREAKDAWKKACNEWKKEFRDDNKENKIIAMSCGSASCGGEVGQKVCTSKATYKIKTKIN